MPTHEKKKHAASKDSDSIDDKKQRGKRDGSSSDKDEDAASNPDSQRKPVIFSDEIAQLQITNDNLVNLSKSADDSANSSQSNYQKVPFRKEIPEADRKVAQKRIGFMRRAPPDAPLKDAESGSHVGPRIDEAGKVVAHSILGSPEEFYKLAVMKGQIRAEDVPDAFRTPPTSGRLSVKYARKQTFPFPVADIAEENAALKNWEKRMADRKVQQGFISKLVQRPAADLVMNKGEIHRKQNEEKHVIDRSIPFIDYGKGYRSGSEFWQQAEQIGDDETGLNMTLTQTQKGFPPAVEHIGHSRIAKSERGINWQRSPRSAGRYPWKGPFYEQRTRQLQQVIQELDPYQPEFEHLEVVGRAPGHVTVRSRPTTAVTPSVTHNSQDQDQASDKLPSIGSRSQSRVSQQDTSELISGPSILFGGEPARWFGDPATYKGRVGIEARVILETKAGKATQQCLSISNDGTTVLFYKWKKLPKPNPFGLVQEEVKKFYFDTSDGVLLPGESLHFPFIFKSNSPGLFAQQWQLQTNPVVCGGAALIVTLRGIATQEDLNAGRRSELEAKIQHQSAHKIIQSLLDEILDGIQVPDRPKTPIDAYITDEEIFLRRNPGLSYTTDSFKMLHKLRADISNLNADVAAAEWDFDVHQLRDEVLQLEDDKQAKNEELTAKLFSVVNRISFGIDLPRIQLGTQQYHLAYGIVMETMDRIYNDWHHQRLIRRLPEVEMDFPDPNPEGSESQSDFSDLELVEPSHLPSDSEQSLDAERDSNSADFHNNAKRSKSDKQKSTLSKESAKTGQRTELSRMSTQMTKERTRSPKRMSSGRKTPVDAAQSQTEQQTDDLTEAEEIEAPEALAERLCRERIYGNTYCMLGDMVETIADICEAAR